MALPASVASALAAVTASVPSLPLFHLLHEVKRRRCPPADDAPVLSGLFDVQVLPPLGSVPEQVAREEVKVSLLGKREEGGVEEEEEEVRGGRGYCLLGWHSGGVTTLGWTVSGGRADLQRQWSCFCMTGQVVKGGWAWDTCHYTLHAPVFTGDTTG